jgi:putative transposase
VESFNGKLRDEVLNREIFYSLKEAKVLIEQWRNEYNTIRPHSGLGYRPPAPSVVAEPATERAAVEACSAPLRSRPPRGQITDSRT